MRRLTRLTHSFLLAFIFPLVHHSSQHYHNRSYYQRLHRLDRAAITFSTTSPRLSCILTYTFGGFQSKHRQTDGRRSDETDDCFIQFFDRIASFIRSTFQFLIPLWRRIFTAKGSPYKNFYYGCLLSRPHHKLSSSGRPGYEANILVGRRIADRLF